MIKAALLLGVALSAAMPATAREIARKCTSSPRPVCHYIFADKDVSSGVYADGHGARVVGPYLSQYQNLVQTGDAPFRVIKARDGKLVVFALAFEKEFRLAGPIFVMYFLDRPGKVVLRSEGDLFLENAQLTELLPARKEFLVVSMRSETGISFTTEVWALENDGPRKVYFDAGAVFSVEKGSKTRRGRITLGGVDHGRILSWDERTQQIIEIEP